MKQVSFLRKLKIIFFGTPSFVVPVLEAIEKDFDLVGIVTAQNQKVGRKQTVTPSPLNLWAVSQKIPVITPQCFDQSANQLIRQLSPDLFVVAAYGKIIPQEVLDIPKFGAINIHPSLLPKYRGASPIQQAILNGDKTIGLSIIKMDDKMDHGSLIYTTKFSLLNSDNFQTLSKKVFEQASEIISDLIPRFVTGKIKIIEQDHQKATFTKLVKKADGYFDLPAGRQISTDFYEKLNRMIRAYYPWPNAWTKWIGKIIKFYPKGMIQMEGKKPTILTDFLNGYPNFPIKSFFDKIS